MTHAEPLSRPLGQRSAEPSVMSDAGERTGLSVPTARSIAVSAVMLGVVADSLFRQGPGWLALGIWITLLALNLVSLVWRDAKTLPRESALWLATAIAFAFGLAWRNSDTLVPLDFLATLACLGMAVIRLRDRRAALFAARFRDTVAGAVRTIADIAIGFLPLAARELFRPTDGAELTGRAKPVVRAGLLAAAVLLVFGSLLRGADPVFASL